MHLQDEKLPSTIVQLNNECKYTESFDQVFKSMECKVMKTAPQSPNLQAFVERVVQTLKHEVLNAFCIVSDARTISFEPLKTGITTAAVTAVVAICHQSAMIIRQLLWTSQKTKLSAGVNWVATRSHITAPLNSCHDSKRVKTVIAAALCSGMHEKLARSMTRAPIAKKAEQTNTIILQIKAMLGAIVKRTEPTPNPNVFIARRAQTTICLMMEPLGLRMVGIK